MTKFVEFFKFQATGNDFIIIDNFDGAYTTNNRDYWAKMCHRQLGIGADGIIFVDKSEKYDFKMVYLNSDGSDASMCGNGARSVAMYYFEKSGLKSLKFETDAGIYQASLTPENFVKLQMVPLKDIGLYDLKTLRNEDSLYVDSGVPHAIFDIEHLDQLDIMNVAPLIRHNKIFPHGANVNFIEKINTDTFSIRTYERGVEGETLSCGTGVVASAYFFAKKYKIANKVTAITRSGNLYVEFSSDWKELFLIGPAIKVFSGKYYE